MTLDRGDVFRRALLTVLFDRMEADPDERERVFSRARSQLALQREKGLSGRKFQARWETFLAMPVSDLRATLLSDDGEGVEARHSHMFAGCLSSRELNAIRLKAASSPE